MSEKIVMERDTATVEVTVRLVLKASDDGSIRQRAHWLVEKALLDEHSLFDKDDVLVMQVRDKLKLPAATDAACELDAFGNAIGVAEETDEVGIADPSDPNTAFGKTIRGVLNVRTDA